MNYQDLNQEQQAFVNQEINNRLGGFRDIMRGLAVSLSKYLITANSGGIIAILTYLHSLSGNQPTPSKIKLSLLCFVIGLICISIVLFWVYYRVWKLDNKYKKDMRLFYENQISIFELRRRDNERTESDKVEYSLAIISFLAFITAIISGALTFV